MGDEESFDPDPPGAKFFKEWILLLRIVIAVLIATELLEVQAS